MANGVSRRQFLCNLTLACAASALVPAESAAGAKEPTWVELAPAQQCKAGSYTHFDLPHGYKEGEVYVTPKDDGSFTALSARCTHMGCIVRFNDADQQFECPCHGGRFDIHGDDIGGPPVKPLKSLKTRVDTQGILSVLAS